ncbi:MAG TPA: hypothetical protein DCY35_11815 [Prolixibacteraceae bacterium]|nr:hypothetical protein [Prolixibacteraceae bacterium]
MMPVELRELKIESEAEWQTLILNDRHADFQQSFQWARMLQLSYGYEPFFLEFSDSGKPVGYIMLFETFPFQKGKNISNAISNSMRKTFAKNLRCYNGPALIRTDLAAEMMDPLISWLDEKSKVNKIKGMKLTLFLYNWHDVNSASIAKKFESNGFTLRKWATYLVDLNQSEDMLWEYIGKSARKSLKKVRESDVQVKRVQNHDEFMEKFIKPYNRMEREHDRSQIPVDHVEKTMNLNYLNKHYHYYYAESQGVIHGAIGMCTFNGWAAEIMSSSSIYAQENHLYVQDALHWQMFLDAKNMGCHTFDMAGVNPEPKSKKEEGIDQFKKKWGGRYVEYPIFEKNSENLISKLRTRPGAASRLDRRD